MKIIHDKPRGTAFRLAGMPWPFDWNNAWACMSDAGDLQRIIEAAFVPWGRYNERGAAFLDASKLANEQAARAEAAEARIEVLEEALTQLRDCDWIITLPDRMDAVRDIARTALKGSTDADLVCGTLGDSDGDDGA